MPAVKRTLAVDLGAGLVLPTPILIASGCAGTGRELAGLVDLHKVGGVVSRSVTVEPDPGTPGPRVSESASGVVWSTGVQNPGIEAFIADELPRLARVSTVFVSIAGATLEEYVRLTSLLHGHPNVAAIEVYLSGPDLELDREVLGAHTDRAAEVVGAVARMSTVPVFAKLPPGSADVVEVARAVLRAGAHGLTLLAPPPALAVDADGLRAGLGGVFGWLSGPATKPVTARAVFEVARALPEAPIIASGGVASGEDAAEMLLAGAWGVQVGTAVLVDPAAPVVIAQGLARFLKAKGLASPADLRGRLRVPGTIPASPGTVAAEPRETTAG